MSNLWDYRARLLIGGWQSFLRGDYGVQFTFRRKLTNVQLANLPAHEL